jgi:hypothetical protein
MELHADFNHPLVYRKIVCRHVRFLLMASAITAIATATTATAMLVKHG